MESDSNHAKIAALLDLQGYNYAGYSADYDAAHEENPDWIIFGSETGAAVRSRGIYHTPADEVIKANEGSSSDQQCSSYDNEAARFGESAEVAYEIDNSRPFVQGSFIWAGFDYIGEPTPLLFLPQQELLLRHHRHRRVPEGHLLLLPEPVDKGTDGPHSAPTGTGVRARRFPSSFTAIVTVSSSS